MSTKRRFLALKYYKANLKKVALPQRAAFFYAMYADRIHGLHNAGQILRVIRRPVLPPCLRQCFHIAPNLPLTSDTLPWIKNPHTGRLKRRHVTAGHGMQQWLQYNHLEGSKNPLVLRSAL